MQNAKMCFKIF